METRTVRAWCWYDFGNSAFAVIFPAIFGTYFAEEVAGGAEGDRAWGLTVSSSMLLVALSAPFVGGVADHAGIRRRMLLLYTVAGIAAVLAFSAVGPGAVGLGFALGALANFAFEGAIVFYNAYLPEIAPVSHQGRVSARGFAFGYVGSFVAIGIAALLREPAGVEAVWAACAIQWAVASAIALRGLPPDRPGAMGAGAAAAEGIRRTFRTLRDVLGRKDLRRFLLAYFIYEDGVNTVIIFAWVYAKKTLGFSFAELLAMIAAVNVAAVFGSMAIAKPTDTKGPRWAISLLLLWWVLVVCGASIAWSRGVFWVVAIMAGLGIGGIQSASRALMARLVPPGREAELFGFYALCGKTGAILGPALFGLVAGAFGLRYGALTVIPFYAVGYLLLRRLGRNPCATEPA